MATSTFSIDQRSLLRTLQKLQKVGGQAVDAGQRALIEIGEIVYSESRKMVPIKLGNLKESAYVVWDAGLEETGNFKGSTHLGQKALSQLRSEHALITNLKRQEASASKKGHFVVFVGHTAYYSIFVHEAAFTYSGQPKFFEVALDLAKSKIDTILVSRIRQVI